MLIIKALSCKTTSESRLMEHLAHWYFSMGLHRDVPLNGFLFLGESGWPLSCVLWSMAHLTRWSEYPALHDFRTPHESRAVVSLAWKRRQGCVHPTDHPRRLCAWYCTRRKDMVRTRLPSSGNASSRGIWLPTAMGLGRVLLTLGEPMSEQKSIPPVALL